MKNYDFDWQINEFMAVLLMEKGVQYSGYI